MDTQNRDNFLNKLAAKMGKALSPQPEAMPTPVNTYPTERLTQLTQTERVDEFIRSAQAMMVDVNIATEAEAANALLALCEKYGGGDIVLNTDERLNALGIPQALKTKYHCHTWSPESAKENIDFSEKANIGVVYADYALAETGGIVLFSSPERGRSVSLLPEKSVVVLRKSQVVPRVAQVAKVLHEKAQLGERMPSCINIISGPSSTADIELIKVIGVHGPVAKIYLVIDDL